MQCWEIGLQGKTPEYTKNTVGCFPHLWTRHLQNKLWSEKTESKNRVGSNNQDLSLMSLCSPRAITERPSLSRCKKVGKLQINWISNTFPFFSLPTMPSHSKTPLWSKNKEKTNTNKQTTNNKPSLGVWQVWIKFCNLMLQSLLLSTMERHLWMRPSSNNTPQTQISPNNQPTQGPFQPANQSAIDRLAALLERSGRATPVPTPTQSQPQKTHFSSNTVGRKSRNVAVNFPSFSFSISWTHIAVAFPFFIQQPTTTTTNNNQQQQQQQQPTTTNNNNHQQQQQ